MKNSEEKNKKSLAWVGIPLSVAVFLLIYLMPRPEGLTTVSQAALAMFSAALILWVAKPIPIYQTSILAILLLPMLGIVKKQSVAFGTLGFDIIWLMVAAFVLTSAMSTSNLGKRIALILVTRFGKTPTKMLAILVVVNFVLAFFVPSTTARASLIMPIALVLLEVYRAIPGESKFGKLMMLQGVQNNAFATSVVMTATAAQVLALGFINQQTNASIGYMDWLLGSFPQAVLTAGIAFIIGLKMYDFKGELGNSSEKASALLQKQLDDLGAMSVQEKKTTVIFLLTLFLWATGDYQKALLGVSISTEQTAVLSMLLCFLPRIGVLTWKDANIKWDLMLFSAGAYAVGNALNDSGGASWAISRLIEAVGLDKMSHGFVAISLIFISVFSHLIFTSKTVRTTILIPAVIALASQLGMNPVSLALACAFSISCTITLPPHSKVNTLYFGTGYFEVRDEFIFGLISCFFCAVAISLVYFFWLPIVLG